MKVTLREHLDVLDQNSKASNENYRSLARRLKQKFVDCGYPRSSQNLGLILEYMHMIFETQGYRCTHWLEVKGDELNGVWNRPGKDYNSWKTPLVKYEIDHVHPRNAGGTDRLDNFQFLSANANQFTKCSLTYDDLFKRLDLSDKLKVRIAKVLSKREQLFRSEKWENFILKLQKFEDKK
tara:strand:- start:1379 stop:1918 length:540 start_codon:yes stop_codon:yes gene_type:complete